MYNRLRGCGLANLIANEQNPLRAATLKGFFAVACSIKQDKQERKKRCGWQRRKNK